MGLPKTFDYILHDLPVTQRQASGLFKDAITVIVLYLKLRKQAVKTNDTEVCLG